MIWYDVWYDVIWYVMIYDMMIWYDDMIWYDMIWWYDMMIWYDIWYDMIWYDMIWYDMIWYDDMIWYMMIYDMIWYDMIWYDMIWYDMIWYDMIWYDDIYWSWSGRRPDYDQQHCYHQVPTIKPEAAIAVVELLMMGMRIPETCWAVFKRQVINLRNYCIWLVESVERELLQFARQHALGKHEKYA